MTAAPPDTVLLVHGLWMPAWSLALLARRLRALGFKTTLFTYPTMAHGLQDSGRALARRRAAIAAPVVHWVGHSLGGLIIRAAFECEPAQPPGRIVTLGTPHLGTVAGRAVRRYLGGGILGRGIADLCADIPSQWRPLNRELGTLAGSKSAGLGRLFAALPEPNDGTVAAAEAILPSATDHIVLPVSHSGMPFSAEVARQTAHFLRSGRFDH